MREPLPLGTKVKPYGKIGAIASLSGERYYFFEDGKDTAMIPAVLIEKMYDEGDKL